MEFNEIIEKIEAAIPDDAGTPMIRYNQNWRYPHLGDDQKSCPLLDFMLQMEYRSGTLIFVPDRINKMNLQDRNKEPQGGVK